MNSARVVVIASCWFSLAMIAPVYMLRFANKLGDFFLEFLSQLGFWFSSVL
jgi:hypothetical protein